MLETVWCAVNRVTKQGTVLGPQERVPVLDALRAVTINYVITDVEKKRKFVCVDTNDIPEVAVIDPDMMASMPQGLTAATGMDALTHAIEGYTTKAAWEMTDMFHLKACLLYTSEYRCAGEHDRSHLRTGRAWH